MQFLAYLKADEGGSFWGERSPLAVLLTFTVGSDGATTVLLLYHPSAHWRHRFLQTCLSWLRNRGGGNLFHGTSGCQESLTKTAAGKATENPHLITAGGLSQQLAARDRDTVNTMCWQRQTAVPPLSEVSVRTMISFVAVVPDSDLLSFV